MVPQKPRTCKDLDEVRKDICEVFLICVCVCVFEISHGDELFRPLECFTLLLSALSHDIGHMSRNNTFLVETKNELALRSVRVCVCVREHGCE